MADNKQAKVTLHWLNGSRAQSILWLMTELDVPSELKIYRRQSSGWAPEELRQVHPLGRSPVVTVEVPGSSGEPIVLAESGFIVEYLCDHWDARGKDLVPARWQPGKEGQVGGETEAWLRHQFLVQFAEGSLMPYLLFALVISRLKSPDAVPFFLRPITGAVADKLNALFTNPNMRKNLQLLEGYLAHPPADGGGSGYLCGGRLTAADILLSFPLIAAVQRNKATSEWADGKFEKEFPLLEAFVKRLQDEPGYRKAAGRIEAAEGQFKALPV